MAARKTGRPKADIDPAQVEELASIMCTVSEIAAVCACDKRTLERRFAAVIERGRERGKESLRRAQYKLAQSGNAVMQIWLGKQYLGQTDKLPEFAKFTDDELIRYAGFVAGAALGPTGTGTAPDGAAGDPEAGASGVN